MNLSELNAPKMAANKFATTIRFPGMDFDRSVALELTVLVPYRQVRRSLWPKTAMLVVFEARTRAIIFRQVIREIKREEKKEKEKWEIRKKKTEY